MLTTRSKQASFLDADYGTFERLVAHRVAAVEGPLFTTNATGLFEAYLDGIPEHHRQHYNCRCCRRFVEKYGSLVSIDEDGLVSPAVWDWETTKESGTFFVSLDCVRAALKTTKVTGVFYCDESVWGTPHNVPGPGSKYVGQRWTHLHGIPQKSFSPTNKLLTADQAMAEKTQDYIMLKRGLNEFPVEAVVQAVRVLEADAVDRSEKTLGVAQWLLGLHRKIEHLRMRKSQQDNVLWLAVAKAPPGFCHVRSTMIATLLDDVVLGLPFNEIQRRWNAKMHPLKYQRPTAAPSEGAIQAANKIVEKMRSEGSLARRFATLDEILNKALWVPKVTEQTPPKLGGGAFDHLLKKTTIKEVELPPAKMAWEKFRDTVLPTALEIEVRLSGGTEGFYGLVTAANSDAPPILQWDGIESIRNPFSWYFYHGGSLARAWGLEPGWAKATSVFLSPPHWQQPDKFKHQGVEVFFALEGAKDLRHKQGGGFFPEMLRSEYHGVRKVLETHVQGAGIAGKDEGTANGIALSGERGLTVRVKTQTGTSVYALKME